jgi:AP-1 complex subunit beta-1
MAEIYNQASTLKFSLTSDIVSKLLSAMNDCTEWGQVFILDSLSAYSTTSEFESKTIIERVLPRLQHVNCAVVISATKVIFKHMKVRRFIFSDILFSKDMKTCREEELGENYILSKVAPPLITLLKAEYEIQFVALQHITLIAKYYPEFLRKDVKVFFCKYNDPAYVKQAKLHMITQLAHEENIKEILSEFLEYCTEVDVEFVRKVVKAIGQCAILVSSSAPECVQLLETLIQMKISYVVQEAIIVLKDIFRQFPNKYEYVISSLCDNLEILDQPEARAAFVWIIGEYAERIDNSSELIETFMESFNEEPVIVQLQILTATVKLYLKKDFPGQLVQDILCRSTVETDNPDLRDRAYVYWRILSGDLHLAKKIIVTNKDVVIN